MSVKFTILGCGSFATRIDGFYGNVILRIKNDQDVQLYKFKNLNILIDTSPDLKSQLLKNKLKTLIKFFIPILMLTKHMELMS